MRPLRFAARNLRREFRYGELATLAIALVLAVTALTAVGTLASRVNRTILASAAELIGGDIGIDSRQPVPRQFAEQARAQGLQTNLLAEFPSVVFAGDKSQFCEVRASDAAFPLRGTLTVHGGDGDVRVAHAPAAGEVYVDQRVLTALAQPIGGSLQLGGRDLRITGVIVDAPGSDLLQLAPRLLMNLDDALASGVLGTGSRARYRLLMSGDERTIETYAAWAKPRLPGNARLSTIEDAQQNLRVAFERGESFLRLAALLAALLSGIAIALAAQRFARRKTDEVALLRCLGASRREILSALTLELAMLALPACLLGLLFGLGLQQAAFAFARDLLPGALPSIPLEPAVAAFAVAIAVLFGFALPPLLRLRDVEPVRVFRRDMPTRPRRFDVLYLLPLLVVAGLLWLESDSAKLAGILAGGLAAVALASLLLGLVLLGIVRVVGACLPGAWRFGIANLARRRTLTLIQVGALAMSVTALNLLAVVGPSLMDRWRADLPADTPNYFLLNLQPEQRASMQQGLDELGADKINLLPLAIGKLVAINGVAPKAEDYPDTRAGNWINGEIRISWSDQLPVANELVDGAWFSAHPATAELSVDKIWVEMFHLKLGDTLTLKVGEQDLTATVTSERVVDWSSFRVNFFMMLDPSHGESLPHSFIASFHLAPVGAQLAALARDFPNVSLIDVNSILDRVRDIIARVSAAATWVLSFSLAAGILVLLAAIAASADERSFEIALLRTLGAHRGQLHAAVLGEFAALGLIAALVAAIGAGATGLALARQVFRLPGYWPPSGQLLTVAAIAALLVTLAGLIATLRIARTPPMRVLRRAE